MKRFLTLLMIAAATLTAHATDYTDQILVLVNGEGSTQEATLSVSEHDGLYDINLKNFILMNGDSPMNVGNVEMKDIVPETSNGTVFLRTTRNITITNGDAPGVLFWMGPMLGELPVEVTAVLDDNGLRALINLDLTDLLGQVINVSFGKALVSGTGYHIPNGDFEAWHTSADGFVEPNAWHSFESASGSLASLAGHHIEKSDKGRNGSSCARIFATSIFGIIANGTMTTGRMNAGAMSATDAANHAYTDMSMTDVDGNGDPFYVALNSRPDSLVLYLQFHQGKTNSKHPYATVSAVITDGTYYQDPEDKTYSNVVARASDSKITVTGDEWRRISIPFVYTDNDVKPRAIMITISTNADPGQGSNNDEVLVDDLTLVYNSRLASLPIEGFQSDVFDYDLSASINAEELMGVADGKAAYVLKRVSALSDDEGKVVFDVYAADLRSISTYTVSYKITESDVKGDVNGDGAVNVADISAIISFMSGEGMDISLEKADVNNDSSVNVADIATVIDIMAAAARLQRDSE